VLLVGKKLLNNRFESNAKLEYQRVGARRERVFNSILWSVKVSEDAFPAAERTPSQTRAKMEKDRISCTRRAAGIPVGHQCDLFHGTVCLEEISQLGFHGCRHKHASMPIPGGAERSSVCQNGEEEDSQEPSDRHEGWRYFLEKADLKAGTDPIKATQKRQMRTWV